MPSTGAQQERFLSLTHVIDKAAPPEGHVRTPDWTTATDGMLVEEKSTDGSLSIFAIATGEVTNIEPAGPLEARIYTGILRALQGPPKTREEVLATLNLADEDERELAEAVFDAFTAYSFVVSTGGLARALT